MSMLSHKPDDNIHIIGVSTSNNGSAVLNYPIRKGDLILYFNIAYRTFFPPSPVIPEGLINFWDQSANDGEGTFQRLMASFRVADGLEDHTVYTGMSGLVLMFSFRRSNPFQIVNLATVEANTSTGNPNYEIADIRGLPMPIISFGIISSNGGPVSFASDSSSKFQHYYGNENFMIGISIFNDLYESYNVQADMNDFGVLNVVGCGYVQPE